MKTTALKPISCWGCLLILVALILAGCSPSPYSDNRGNAVTLKSDKGQWLVLNVWAEWCEPCRAEIPELNELAADGAVRVLGIDFDFSEGEVLDGKIALLDIRFPVIEQSPLAHLGVALPQVLPATLILSPQGQVLDTVYGPQTRLSLERRIRQWQERENNG